MTLPLHTTLRDDRYRVEELLAEGGMGAVYRGWDLRLQVPCAIKENLATHRYSNIAEALTEQFEREAIILASLNHPNLPRVTNHFIEANENQYLVMDYVEGEDLANLIEREGPLPERQVLGLVVQVCDALTYLHTRPAAPVIHRDVKPQNIKVKPDGQVLLVDFGLSKLDNPNMSTLAGAKGWSAGFSPPEQYDMGRTTARSDIYALGATMYNLLTGEIPPEGYLRKAGIEKLRPVRELNPKISKRTAAAIERALAIEQADRFESVEAFRAALPKKEAVATTMPSPAPEEPAGAALLISKAKRTYRLSQPGNLIGRLNRRTGEAPDVDLSAEPDGDTVSRKHAEIFVEHGQWHLRPHSGHKNVIKVNGRRVGPESVPIRSGDKVQVGAVVLRFETAEKA